MRLTLVLILPVAFLGSCVAMLPVAAQLADPMTHRPVDWVDSPFPILVVNASQASVLMTDTPHDVQPPPAGSSYLVPRDRVAEIERYIRDHDTVHRDSGWVLRVKQIAADRQRIELFLMGDGYWGGVYEATASGITPQYRKITGPAFALVFGPLSMVLNAALWGVGILGIIVFRRHSGAAQQRLAADGGRTRAG